VDRLRGVVWGTEEPRIRAIYRILIPILLLTIGLTRLAVNRWSQRPLSLPCLSRRKSLEESEAPTPRPKALLFP